MTFDPSWRLRRADCVSHGGAARTQRLFSPHRGVPSGLMLDLGIQLRPQENEDRGHPHPHHSSDRGAERTVGRIVIGEIGEIVGQDGGAGEPREGGENGAGAVRNVVGIIIGVISEKLIIAYYAASSIG